MQRGFTFGRAFELKRDYGADGWGETQVSGPSGKGKLLWKGSRCRVVMRPFRGNKNGRQSGTGMGMTNMRYGLSGVHRARSEQGNPEQKGTEGGIGHVVGSGDCGRRMGRVARRSLVNRITLCCGARRVESRINRPTHMTATLSSPSLHRSLAPLPEL
jgi:hypothetical protein